MTDRHALLAIDTAASSGWCLFDSAGKHVASGVVDAFGDDPAAICRRALELDPHCWLVLERPWGGTLQTVQGLGAARGAWLVAWRRANNRRTIPRITSVFPQVWRAKLFGSGASFPMQEKLTAQVLTGQKDVQPDQAAACCIALWGWCAGVGKSRARKAKAA